MRELLFAHERSETEGAKMTFLHPISLRKHFREKKKSIVIFLPSSLATAMAPKASTRPCFQLYDFRNFNGNQGY